MVGTPILLPLNNGLMENNRSIKTPRPVGRGEILFFEVIRLQLRNK